MIIGEAAIKESGRVSFSAETDLAIGALGRNERDAVLDFVEKEERLFKDFEKNVSSVPTPILVISGCIQMLIT